jgi:hypothetical protein
MSMVARPVPHRSAPRAGELGSPEPTTGGPEDLPRVPENLRRKPMTGPASRLSQLCRWRVLRWALALPALPLALWACNSHPLEAPIPLPEQQNDQYYEVNPIRDIDIVFMVDNSPSMQQEQDNLRRNFPAFIDELKKIPGGLPSLHIGVISSDLGAGPTPLMGGCGRVAGDRGIFQVKPGCGLNPNEVFLTSTPNGTATPAVNFQGELSDVFSCMANLGVAGCGYEHQLQATRVALYETITPANKGFLRENAFLALIFITDEDDCSADINSDLFTDDMTFAGTAASFRCAQVGHLCGGKTPPIGEFAADLTTCDSNEAGRLLKVQEMVESIRMVKAKPDQQILVAGIFGWPNSTTGAQYRYVKGRDGWDYGPTCTSANGEATAALRMKKFVDAFGKDNGSFFSICQDDFRPAMKQIGEKLAAKLGNPCISAPLVDNSPNPGLQPDCQVIDQEPATGGGYTYNPLPPCGNGKTPCWKLAPEAMCGDSGFKIDVDRAGILPKPGTQQAIKCLTCAKPDDPRCVKQ